MATLAAARAHPAAVSPTADPAAIPAGSAASLALLLRFSAVMTVALAAASLPASSFFAVRQIVVTGARTVSAAQVVARSGVRTGDRLLGISPARTAARIAMMPRIAEASVTVGLGGRVTIHLRERTAYAAVPFRGRYLVLDPSGVVMDTAAGSGTLPVVTADRLQPAWMRAGDRLPDPRVGLALGALAELPPELVTPGVRIRADAAGELSFLTQDRITVRLGPRHGLRERAALLPELLRAVRTRGLTVEYLDLRYAGNVVMKPLQWPGAGERP